MEHLNLIISIVVGVLTILGFVTGVFKRAYSFFIVRLFQGSQANRYPPRKSIVIVPKPGKGNIWWHMGAQSGEPSMQVVARYTVTNITEHEILLPVARMKKPRIYGAAFVKDAHSQYYGGYGIPPRHTTDLSLYFWIMPPLKAEGEAFLADIAILDQFGNEHWIKGVEFLYH